MLTFPFSINIYIFCYFFLILNARLLNHECQNFFKILYILLKHGCLNFANNIGVAPITQLRMCVIKIVMLKGGHLMPLELFSIPKGTALKGKNSLPLETNSFL